MTSSRRRRAHTWRRGARHPTGCDSSRRTPPLRGNFIHHQHRWRKQDQQNGVLDQRRSERHRPAEARTRVNISHDRGEHQNPGHRDQKEARGGAYDTKCEAAKKRQAEYPLADRYGVRDGDRCCSTPTCHLRHKSRRVVDANRFEQPTDHEKEADANITHDRAARDNAIQAPSTRMRLGGGAGSRP